MKQIPPAELKAKQKYAIQHLGNILRQASDQISTIHYVLKQTREDEYNDIQAEIDKVFGHLDEMRAAIEKTELLHKKQSLKLEVAISNLKEEAEVLNTTEDIKQITNYAQVMNLLPVLIKNDIDTVETIVNMISPQLFRDVIGRMKKLQPDKYKRIFGDG